MAKFTPRPVGKFAGSNPRDFEDYLDTGDEVCMEDGFWIITHVLSNGFKLAKKHGKGTMIVTPEELADLCE